MSIYIKSITLVIGVFLLRPTALGQQYTTFGVILVLFAFGIHMLECLKNRKSYFVTRKNFIIILTSVLLWTYLLSHALVAGSNHLDFVIKASIAHIIVISCAAVILSHQKSNYMFFRHLMKIFIFFSITYTLTFILGMFLGISFDRLKLFNLPVEGYEQAGEVYFPFTQLYGFMTVGSLQLPRGLGFFRESGIFQAFLIWAFFNLNNYRLDNKKNKVLLFLGIVGTFSTTGIVTFFTVFAIKLFLTKRRFWSLILVSLSIFVLFYAPYIGLKSKSVTHSTSISDRSFATKTGLERLIENPVGIGLYNTESSKVANEGINLLAMSYTVGIIGLIIILVTYFLPIYGYAFKRSYLVGVIPFFITFLISQPILDAPFIYLMFMADYGSLTSFENDIKVKSDITKERDGYLRNIS
ncbi:hypothetical protein [Fictibacillus sp. KU28468]|uniref:hypothetical protein n=1 Tax=Fictibacillus sp. KU28468 TaxID=2991053 RepID=UPI00223E7B1F|nr:hypothetical protein [Fictibacillus sp. KU28468]UZJ79343.1 hypothetical protein OKX00_02300 [Fictibacillus sp. KU28468]